MVTVLEDKGVSAPSKHEITGSPIDINVKEKIVLAQATAQIKSPSFKIKAF
jgi:hypothetical protein